MAAGRIDMLSMDGSVLWLHKVTGNDRSLFLCSGPPPAQAPLKVYRSRSPRFCGGHSRKARPRKCPVMGGGFYRSTQQKD